MGSDTEIDIQTALDKSRYEVVKEEARLYGTRSVVEDKYRVFTMAFYNGKVYVIDVKLKEETSEQ